MNTTVNGLSFDVEDWFQVENLRGAIKREEWDRMPLRVADSTRSITAALARTDTKATFFFLGWVAERLPDLVREISDAGHEIAAHGYGHELVYRMTPEEFRQWQVQHYSERLSQAKTIEARSFLRRELHGLKKVHQDE